MAHESLKRSCIDSASRQGVASRMRQRDGRGSRAGRGGTTGQTEILRGQEVTGLLMFRHRNHFPAPAYL